MKEQKQKRKLVMTIIGQPDGTCIVRREFVAGEPGIEVRRVTGEKYLSEKG